jgi:hypothetical protein
LERRSVLLLPFWLAACADYDEGPPTPAPRNFAPLHYDYLPPINLAVQRIEVGSDFTPSRASGEIIDTSPVNAADTLYAMARDRLRPVAASGIATFQILTASIIRRGDQLNGILEIRLDVRNGDDTNTGFVEARVSASHTGPIRDQQSAVYDMLKSMMDNMNVEMEYQLRKKLRTWIVDRPAAPQAAPPAVSPTEPEAAPPPPEPPPDQSL